MNTKMLAAAVVVCLVTVACEPAIGPCVFALDGCADGEGGAGGEGGGTATSTTSAPTTSSVSTASTSTTTSTTTSAPTCEPSPAFEGSGGEVCSVVDPLCCDTTPGALAEICEHYFGTALPVPYTCGSFPTPGAATDFRECAKVPTSTISCTWGSGIVVCCAP